MQEAHAAAAAVAAMPAADPAEPAAGPAATLRSFHVLYVALAQPTAAARVAREQRLRRDLAAAGWAAAAANVTRVPGADLPSNPVAARLLSHLVALELAAAAAAAPPPPGRPAPHALIVDDQAHVAACDAVRV